MLVPPPKTVLESNILYGVKGAESFHIYICAAMLNNQGISWGLRLLLRVSISVSWQHWIRTSQSLYVRSAKFSGYLPTIRG